MMTSVPPEVAEEIERAILALEPRTPGHINREGIRYHALPLVGMIGEVWLLRPDGSLWRADEDFGLELEPLPSEFQITALAEGARRFPFLKPLLPNRPADAEECAQCGGTGLMSPQKFFCPKCQSLGWTVEVDAT